MNSDDGNAVLILMSRAPRSTHNIHSTRSIIHTHWAWLDLSSASGGGSAVYQSKRSGLPLDASSVELVKKRVINCASRTPALALSHPLLRNYLDS